jgi:hypothetical protein
VAAGQSGGWVIGHANWRGVPDLIQYPCFRTPHRNVERLALRRTLLQWPSEARPKKSQHSSQLSPPAAQVLHPPSSQLSGPLGFSTQSAAAPAGKVADTRGKTNQWLVSGWRRDGSDSSAAVGATRHACPPAAAPGTAFAAKPAGCQCRGRGTQGPQAHRPYM